MMLNLWRVRCDVPGCDCYVGIDFRGPRRYLWECLRDCATASGFVMGPSPRGPHYCGCGHVREGSRDPR